MNTTELAEAIAVKFGATQQDARDFLDAFTEVVREQLVAGNPVVLHRFGTFKVRRTAARQGRNPMTGRVITIPVRARVLFAPSSELKDAVNPR